jgi:hypothetical protein
MRHGNSPNLHMCVFTRFAFSSKLLLPFQIVISFYSKSIWSSRLLTIWWSCGSAVPSSESPGSRYVVVFVHSNPNFSASPNRKVTSLLTTASPVCSPTSHFFRFGKLWRTDWCRHRPCILIWRRAWRVSWRIWSESATSSPSLKKWNESQGHFWWVTVLLGSLLWTTLASGGRWSGNNNKARDRSCNDTIIVQLPSYRRDAQRREVQRAIL